MVDTLNQGKPTGGVGFRVEVQLVPHLALADTETGPSHQINRFSFLFLSRLNCFFLFLLTLYVASLQETKMRGVYFYLGACTQGKIGASHLVRTASPPHTA